MTDEREYRREDDERLSRIELGVATIVREMADLRVNVEHRVTKLETRAAFSGFLGGVVASIMASVIAAVILAVVLK